MFYLTNQGVFHLTLKKLTTDQYNRAKTQQAST